MGMTLKALLYYGFPLAETVHDGDDYDEDKDSWYNDEGYDWERAEVERQAPPPTDKDYKSAAWEAWRERRKEVLATIPCTAEIAGYGDYTYGVLAIRNSLRIAYASSTAITLPEFDAAWDGQLREWCERYGFKYGVPSWQLAPLYW